MPAGADAARRAVPLAACLALAVSRRDLPAAVTAALPRPEPVLAALGCEPDARILADWHHVTPLWYANTTDRRVEYVHPEGAEPIGQTWRRRALLETGPALLTRRSAEMGGTDAPVWPLPGTAFYLTEPPPAAACRPPSTTVGSAEPGAPGPVGFAHLIGSGARLGDAVQIDGVYLETSAWGPPTLHVRAHAIAEVTATLTLFAQLVDPRSGVVWAQTDRAVAAERWTDPRGIARRLPLWTFRGAPPGELRILLGAYRNAQGGPERLLVRPASSPSIAPHPSVARMPPDMLDLGTLSATRDMIAPALDAGAVPFGHAMQLESTRVRRAGDEIVVDLTWLAEAGAGASDYTVSVQASGDGWTAQHDGTPAQGMIPTLKWLPGMVVFDRHRLALPPSVGPDATFEVRVSVYDAFSLEPLEVTDRQLSSAGQGQAARVHPR